jgi:hypothetical protein
MGAPRKVSPRQSQIRDGPLGLFAEKMDPVTNRHLGNYPQALTHAALLQAALSLRLPRGDE